jgi:hypothetical protein
MNIFKLMSLPRKDLLSPRMSPDLSTRCWLWPIPPACPTRHRTSRRLTACVQTRSGLWLLYNTCKECQVQAATVATQPTAMLEKVLYEYFVTRVEV